MKYRMDSGGGGGFERNSTNGAKSVAEKDYSGRLGWKVGRSKSCSREGCR